MKNINKFLGIALLSVSISFLSCDNSEDFDEVVSQIETTDIVNTIFIETDATQQEVAIANVDESQNITVGVNTAISTDVDFTFNVTKDGSAAVLNTDYTVDNTSLLSGDTNITANVTFLAAGRYEVFVAGSSSADLTIVENKSIFLVPSPVKYTFEWADDFYDYDVFIFDVLDPDLVDVYDNFDSSLVTTVYGYSGETVALEEISTALPIGSAYIFVEDYWNDNASVPVVLTVTVAGESPQVFNLTIDKDKYVLKIETSLNADASDIEYTFTAL